MKVKNVPTSAKIRVNVQTIRDCALHQWNVRYVFYDTVLKKRWRKCPHFHIFRVFLKNNYFPHKYL